MNQSRRDRFLRRISTVGGGTRDAIQMAIGGVVFDLRDMVERGVFSEDEMELVVSFHDQAEEFWRRTMSTTPPMDPQLMVSGLRRLREECKGPLEGFGVRVDQAVERAQSFAARKTN